MHRISKFVLLLFALSFASADMTINIWHQMLYENRKVLGELTAMYEERHPGIRINNLYRETEELRSNYQSSAMGGSGPEIIYGPSDQIGPFATMGIVKELDDVFPEGFFDQFVDNAIVRFDGKIWAIGDVVGNFLMLLYNKDLLPEPPKTTDELIRFGKELTIDENGDGKIDQFGLVWNFTEPFFFVPWVAGFGDWIIKDEVVPNINTPATVEAFRFIKSLRDEHKIIPLECDYEIANAMFKTGTAAMIVNGDWSWGDYQGLVNFGIAPLPQISSTGGYPAPMVGTKGYSINVNVEGERLDVVKDIIMFLTGAEAQLYIAKKLQLQPTNKEVLSSVFVQENKRLNTAAEIIKRGKAMPIVPEMRAIWDGLRTEYQKLLGGNTSPEDAATNAQILAESNIRNMNEVLLPGGQAKFLRVLFPIIILLLLWFSRKFFRDFFLTFRENKFAYFMLFPAIIGIFSVVIFPFFYNVMISLSNFSLNTFRDWQLIGFQHYFTVFTDPAFYRIFLKTVIWTVVNLTFHVSLGVFLAVLINRTLPAKRTLRTLLIIPWAVPQYITALTWRGMFNQEYGSINLLLERFLAMEPIQWLSQPFEAFSACIITNIWLGFPFMMVIALGGLQSIPRDLYEAAQVDGATKWQQFWHITVPMLKPVMIPAITLGTIWTFNNINVVWLVSNAGEPSDSTHILVSFVYKAAFNLYRYGYAAALSMVIFFILLTFGVLFLNRSKATKSMY